MKTMGKICWKVKQEKDSCDLNVLMCNTVCKDPVEQSAWFCCVQIDCPVQVTLWFSCIKVFAIQKTRETAIKHDVWTMKPVLSICHVPWFDII